MKDVVTRAALCVVAVPYTLLGVSGFLTEDAAMHRRHDIAYSAVAAIRSALPGSKGLEFQSVRVTDTGTTCVEYRARNLDGVVAGRAASIDGGVVGSWQDGRFAQTWDMECRGMGHDVTAAVDRFF